ncbi:hypothetical protein SBA6_410012 [Candidatus Sulfopaludibacter sp. SbA6]|nr:hypothetical protein SBA6_410012 [Candidatus Sulfopaludibacter sp. SbA6]
MTVQIGSPEFEALINQRLQAGGFKSAAWKSGWRTSGWCGLKSESRRQQRAWPADGDFLAANAN